MNNIFKSALALTSGLVALFLVGCGGDSGGGGTSTGPESGAAFDGASFSFNPTVTFTSGTTFSWENVNGDVQSLVITDPGAPATGTFTYVPSSDFKTGTLSFTFTDPGIPAKQLNLSNFTGTVNGITSFSISVDSVSYNGQILTSGSPLLPKITITVGGGGGGGSIANGTTYNGTLSAAYEVSASGPNSASLNPSTLAAGSTQFLIASDRSKVKFNGITAGINVGTTVPGLGGTGVYALKTSPSSTKLFSIIFDGSGVPVEAFYDSMAFSGDFMSTRTLRQDISGLTVAP